MIIMNSVPHIQKACVMMSFSLKNIKYHKHCLKSNILSNFPIHNTLPSQVAFRYRKYPTAKSYFANVNVPKDSCFGVVKPTLGFRRWFSPRSKPSNTFVSNLGVHMKAVQVSFGYWKIARLDTDVNIDYSTIWKYDYIQIEPDLLYSPSLKCYLCNYNTMLRFSRNEIPYDGFNPTHKKTCQPSPSPKISYAKPPTRYIYRRCGLNGGTRQDGLPCNQICYLNSDGLCRHHA